MHTFARDIRPTRFAATDDLVQFGNEDDAVLLAALERLGLGIVLIHQPRGFFVVEVPNVGGLGAGIFGKAWSGLELPRHLSHFSPHTLTRAVEQAGGRVAWCWHGAKPRYYLWSLGFCLRDRGSAALARFIESRPIYGVLKLFLEVTLPLARLARRGEVIRIGIRPK
mgnify:CR=1 FL=1